MSRDPGWEEIRTAISAHLEPGESLDGMFTAVMPDEGRSGGLTFAPFGLVVLAAEYAMRRSSLRKTARAAGVPLTPRMIIGLTPRRLAIGQAGRGWRLRTITGDLPRDQIANVELGAASDRTRRVVLRLSNGESITLRMTRASADRFRDLLS